MPSLLLGTTGGSSTAGNEQAKAGALPRTSADPIGFSVERLSRLAGWTLVGVSFLYLAVRAVPVLADSSWWQAGTQARQAVRLRQEGERLLEAVRALDHELAARTRLAPIVAAVAFSSVPALLVDEMEVLSPFPERPGRVRIKIRSYDADGMGALATFGAMVGMGFERSMGRKIQLSPTGLQIPYSLDGGNKEVSEPIRAILIAPLRWEDLR